MAESTDLFLSLQEALAGRYSIDREIGRGGMGVVFLAHEVHLDRLVAIKVLPPERASDPALRERFLREVRMAARLSHPNIIPIHAVEETERFVFYVMAFIDGETLTDRVRARGPFSGSEGARVLREVAWALAYAHGQGIVHRDVKPDNILIERATNRVLVADFGIAAALGDASVDGVTGTPEVMSPEQVLGKSLDARTDLYAMGATGYFAFSGRYPFEGTTTTELLAKHVTAEAPALSAIGVPRKIAALMKQCLRKDPADRPADANHVAEKLTLVLEQRREIPVVLRSFIKRAARMDSTGTFTGAVLLLPVSVLAAARYGSLAGFGTLIGVATAAPLTYMTGVARRLVRQGFAHADLDPAFRAEIEQTEEELSLESPEVEFSPVFQQVLKSFTFLSVGVAAVAYAVMLFAYPSPRGFLGGPVGGWIDQTIDLWLMPILVLSSLSSLLGGFLWGSYAKQKRDVDTRFWSRLWQGPMGRAAFGLASRFTSASARTTAMTHRATELSIGLAAEQLFETLPKDVRKELAGVPQLVSRLQADVQSLRRQQEELQELAALSPIQDFSSRRASVNSKLTEAVGALETLRLDLLRLHAGSTTVKSVTTHMGIAEDVSREINRMIAANADVDRLLAFPTEAEPTPV
jgi:serine/threonine-protein kinase